MLLIQDKTYEVSEKSINSELGENTSVHMILSNPD